MGKLGATERFNKAEHHIHSSITATYIVAGCLPTRAPSGTSSFEMTAVLPVCWLSCSKQRLQHASGITASRSRYCQCLAWCIVRMLLPTLHNNSQWNAVKPMQQTAQAKGKQPIEARQDCIGTYSISNPSPHRQYHIMNTSHR